jgi:hypothetical protein
VQEKFLEESSKEEIETIAKGPKFEATVHIENISKQAVREAMVTQLDGGEGKETKIVVEEVESSIREAHKVLEQLDIPSSLLFEPSPSGETSPAHYNILFGNMIDEEGNAINETEAFRFPILDITIDFSMNNIPL